VVCGITGWLVLEFLWRRQVLHRRRIRHAHRRAPL
jgi:hypothetical protein